MKWRTACLIPWVAAVLCLSAPAHPASGIVVTPENDVLFIYSRHGVMQLDAAGKLTLLHPTRGGHWMALDETGSFSRAQPPNFERITPDGVRPAVLFADGAAPLAVLRDGNLYYGSNTNGDPGGLTVTRMSPAGKRTEFTPELTRKLASYSDGVTGLAEGPDGELYVAAWNGIFKVKMDGTVTTVVYPVGMQDCDEIPPDNDRSRHTPYLRGLAVDAQGTIYVAASGCRRLLRVTPGGKVTVLLRSEPPWSPTGVAVKSNDVYILEYNNPNLEQPGGWRPRVRKISADGTVSTLVTLPPIGELQGR